MKFDIDLLVSLSERKQICIITELLREGWERTSVCLITWEGDRKLSQVKTQQERLEERCEVRWGEENKRKLIEVMRSEEGEDIFAQRCQELAEGRRCYGFTLSDPGTADTLLTTLRYKHRETADATWHT